MPLRPPAGFISAFYDPLRNPNAPTIGTATAGDTTASVAFTAPTDVGGSAITGYGARSTPDNVTATAAASPISVTGLTNGTAYTFAVWAINSYGPSAFSGASGSVTPAALTGLFALGYTNTSSNVIDFITITSPGNAADFGDLTVARYNLAGCASSTRGLFGGGDSGTKSNVIDYVTIASAGNATDFGDLTVVRDQLASCSSSTRGVFAGGNDADGSLTNVIDYVTIASAGNATDFGDLNNGARQRNAGCSSSTRGLFGGGNSSTGTATVNSQIFYITIASTGNSSTFGNLTTARQRLSACSSDVRGVFGGGSNTSGSETNIIDYVTIASTGNAIDFGDLAVDTARLAACSSIIRGVFGGGRTNVTTNTISYITIASTGDATDFGDLTAGAMDNAACSNCHGGL